MMQNGYGHSLAAEDAMVGAYMGEPMAAPIAAAQTLTDAVTQTMSKQVAGNVAAGGSVMIAWLGIVGLLVVMHVLTLRWQS